MKHPLNLRERDQCVRNAKIGYWLTVNPEATRKDRALGDLVQWLWLLRAAGAPV